MNGKQHYLIGEKYLQQAEVAEDKVFGYCLAAVAQAHFQAAIAASHLGYDREELREPPPPPKPVGVGLPIPGRKP